MAIRLPLPGRRPSAVPRFLPFQSLDYRRYWGAVLADEVAGWMLFAIQGWLLIELTRKPQVVVLYFVLRMLPKALLALPAGAICDRIGPLPVLRLARLAGAAPALVILLATLAGQLTIDILLISAVLTSAGHAFERPAYRSLSPGYAPGSLLVPGVALLGMASTLAVLVAPVVFVASVAVGGVLWALPVQILLATVSGAVLWWNRAPVSVERQSAGSLGKDCLGTLRYLASTPGLIVLMVLVSSPGLLDRLLTFLTPGYAQGYGGGQAALTLLFLAPATGALIGGSVLAWIGGEVRRLLPLALGSSSVAVVSVSLLATTQLFLLSILLFLLLGAAKAAFSVAMMSALQRRVPDHARGRILAF
jgi:hypothetical protein